MARGSTWRVGARVPFAEASGSMPIGRPRWRLSQAGSSWVWIHRRERDSHVSLTRRRARRVVAGERADSAISMSRRVEPGWRGSVGPGARREDVGVGRFAVGRGRAGSVTRCGLGMSLTTVRGIEEVHLNQRLLHPLDVGAGALDEDVSRWRSSARRARIADGGPEAADDNRPTLWSSRNHSQPGHRSCGLARALDVARALTSRIVCRPRASSDVVDRIQETPVAVSMATT